MPTSFTPFPLPEFFILLMPLFLVVALWTIVLKGYALWHAARNGQTWWFIPLLVINTLGILELVYLIWYCPSSPLKRRAVSSSASA